MRMTLEEIEGKPTSRFKPLWADYTFGWLNEFLLGDPFAYLAPKWFDTRYANGDYLVGIR